MFRRFLPFLLIIIVGLSLLGSSTSVYGEEPPTVTWYTGGHVYIWTNYNEGAISLYLQNFNLTDCQQKPDIRIDLIRTIGGSNSEPLFVWECYDVQNINGAETCIWKLYDKEYPDPDKSGCNLRYPDQWYVSGSYHLTPFEVLEGSTVRVPIGAVFDDGYVYLTLLEHSNSGWVWGDDNKRYFFPCSSSGGYESVSFSVYKDGEVVGTKNLYLMRRYDYNDFSSVFTAGDGTYTFISDLEDGEFYSWASTKGYYVGQIKFEITVEGSNITDSTNISPSDDEFPELPDSEEGTSEGDTDLSGYIEYGEETKSFWERIFSCDEEDFNDLFDKWDQLKQKFPFTIVSDFVNIFPDVGFGCSVYTIHIFGNDYILSWCENSIMDEIAPTIQWVLRFLLYGSLFLLVFNMARSMFGGR